MSSVHDRITKWLDQEGVSYQQSAHAPTLTSADSARERGDDLAIGAKALLLKVGKDFGIYVLSAAQKLNSKAIKQHHSAKKLRFATPEELLERTGLLPGAVPPFGEPVFTLPLYVDTSLPELERIAFNAGSLTQSLGLATADYLRVARPEIFSFSKTDIMP